MSKDLFHSIYHQGFCRVAASYPRIALGSPIKNACRMQEILETCHKNHVALAVFPELSLTGYSLDDLFFQQSILNETLTALQALIHESKKWMTVGIVGLPLVHNQTLYNCAAVFHRGRLLGFVPKTHIVSEGEFYESRHFASGKNIKNAFVTLWGQQFPIGTDLLFQAEDFPDLCFGIEICQDLWVPDPPGIQLVNAGALVLANLSASPALVGRPKDRSLLCASHSRRLMSAYIYAAAGWGESTNDLAWDGQLMIYEAGNELANTASPLPEAENLCIRDIDLQSLRAKRLKSGYFRHANTSEEKNNFTRIPFKLAPKLKDVGLKRAIAPFPFHFSQEEKREKSREVLEYQATSLAKRLQTSKVSKMIIGVSGGLDSALALLVCCRAADILNWPHDRIIGCSLPGYGTSNISEKLGTSLMDALKIDKRHIDIRPICQAIFKSLNHPAQQLSDSRNLSDSAKKKLYDLTFENVQAGVRTDFLFRLAGQENGLVIGTGDLSELALGWCTYGVGDQMAHYNVNAGLPKTLIQQLVSYFSHKDSAEYFSDSQKILAEIVKRPISPELLPGDTQQNPQSTEASIGPYNLQDFILWHVLVYGAPPERIAFLLEKTWSDRSAENTAGLPKYNMEEIIRWLDVFGRRFFNFSQFKRSAMPNGPKILPDIGLSPRADWRAPSDLNIQIWEEAIEKLRKIFA